MPRSNFGRFQSFQTRCPMPDNELTQTDEQHSRWDNVRLWLIGAILLSLFCGVGGPFVFVLVVDQPDRSRWTRAQSEMGEIQKMLNRHAIDHGGTYPATLAGLGTAYGPLPQDPFTQSDYLYTRKGDGFELRCLGADGAPGGVSGADRDIVYDETGLQEPSP